jgi:uncharacterized protein YegJ (DUF2314 family)
MYKALQFKTLFLACLLFVAACAPSSPTPVPVSTFTDPDPDLQAAIRQAQDTLYIFRQAFLAPKTSYTLISLKIRFADDNKVEDMWTEPVYILDDVYTVRMVEGVTLEKGIHPDRLLDVKLKDIVDWMLLEEDGTVIGGYTLRLEYERLTPAEQKRYRENTGYRFD